jgi:hypothetical protein
MEGNCHILLQLRKSQQIVRFGIPAKNRNGDPSNVRNCLLEPDFGRVHSIFMSVFRQMLTAAHIYLFVFRGVREMTRISQVVIVVLMRLP